MNLVRNNTVERHCNICYVQQPIWVIEAAESSKEVAGRALSKSSMTQTATKYVEKGYACKAEFNGLLHYNILRV